ncbi:MAG: HdeD family acid-resistance protein [Gammaproteobacteria bacterium]
MSTTNEAAVSALRGAVFGELKKKWGWLLALGVLLIALGTLGLWMSFAMTLVTVKLFGALLMVGGVFQLLNAFQLKGWKSVLWHVLIALLYIAAGIVIFTDPVFASLSLTIALAWILIAVGVMRIFMSFQLRPASGWGWPLVSGLISILLGAMILAQWPASGFWVIGLFVSIEMIVNGWSSVFVALAARKAVTTE